MEIGGLSFGMLSKVFRAAPSEQELAAAQKDVTLRKLPLAFGMLVDTHVQAIFSNGYAEALSSEDFDHGHIVWKKWSGNRHPELLSGDLSAIELIMYHTAEYNKRWEVREAHLPVEQRTPRSIVGYPSGKIVTAASCLPEAILPKMRDYSGYGTIHDFELFTPIYDGRTRLRMGSVQFQIAPDPEGNFSVMNVKYDVFYRPDQALCLL